MSDALYSRQMELGPMQNFVYLIGDRQTRDCVVVNPGGASKPSWTWSGPTA